MKQVTADVVVIGAGSAGLCAAYQAAHAGADVLVIDENHLPGGQLFKQIHKFFGHGCIMRGRADIKLDNNCLNVCKTAVQKSGWIHWCMEWRMIKH